MCAKAKANSSSAKASAVRVVPAVSRKYLGETEKNLRRTLPATKTVKTTLFLDEADALLSKRTEVKDAHDRYANIEVKAVAQPRKRKKKP